MSWREKTMSGNVPPQVVFSQDNVAGAQPLWGIGARLADHARGPRRSPLAVQRGNRSGPPGPTKAVIVGQLLRNRGQQAGEHRAGLGCGPFGNHLRDPILVLGGPVDQGPQPGPVRRTLDPGIAEIGQAGCGRHRLEAQLGVLVVAELLGRVRNDNGQQVFLVKGGSSIELRLGVAGSRTSKDLDAVFRGDFSRMYDAARDALAKG